MNEQLRHDDSEAIPPMEMPAPLPTTNGPDGSLREASPVPNQMQQGYSMPPGQNAPQRAPQQAQKPKPRRHTGTRETKTVRVEHSARNQAGRASQGSDAHEFVIEHDGFGHHRVANAHADAPWFESEDDLLDWLTGEHVEGGSLVEDE